MKNCRLIALLPLALALILLASCAVKQEPVAEPEPTPEPEAEATVTLAYKMPDDRTLRYGTTIEQKHEMELMGRLQQSSIFKSNECTIAAGGPETADHDLQVTIDFYELRVEAPRGTIGREISEIVGKSFYLALSPTGMESGFKMTREVAFELQPLGQMTAANDFEGFFPDLPGWPLSEGDSWKGLDHISDTTFKSGQKIVLETAYRLAGFETMDGMECAKIAGTINGWLEPDEAAASMSHAPPPMTARFNGTGHWLFAIDEGLLVKRNVTLHGAGQLVTGGGQGPPARQSQHLTISTQLLK